MNSTWKIWSWPTQIKNSSWKNGPNLSNFLRIFNKSLRIFQKILFILFSCLECTQIWLNYFRDDCHLDYITQSLKKTLVIISQLEQEKKSIMFEHLLNYYSQVYKLLYSHVIYYYSHIAIWLWSLFIVITTRKWLSKYYSIFYYMTRNGH